MKSVFVREARTVEVSVPIRVHVKKVKINFAAVNFFLKKNANRDINLVTRHKKLSRENGSQKFRALLLLLFFHSLATRQRERRATGVAAANAGHALSRRKLCTRLVYRAHNMLRVSRRAGADARRPGFETAKARNSEMLQASHVVVAPTYARVHDVYMTRYRGPPVTRGFFRSLAALCARGEVWPKRGRGREWADFPGLGLREKSIE